MELVYKWRLPDFKWRSPTQKQEAVRSGAYKPQHAVPFSVEVAGDRLFLTYGSFRPGSPATLATVPRTPQDTESPLLQPYPSWDWHVSSEAQLGQLDCDTTLLNVLRVKRDSCGRLWMVDTGTHAFVPNVFLGPARCPAKLIVFDLSTDKPVRRYHLPTNQYQRISTVSSITVDTSTSCDDAFGFWTDSLGYSVGTYSWKSNSSWIFKNSRFTPSLGRALFLNVEGVQLPVPDGVYQVILPARGSSKAYWHSLTSYEENTVPIAVLRDPYAAPKGNFSKVMDIIDCTVHPRYLAIQKALQLGSRGSALGQEVMGAVDSRGIMFYTLASLDALACWNTRQPYRRDTQAVLSRGSPGTLYPGGLTIVPGEEDPGEEEVWLLSSAGLRTAIPLLFNVSPKEYNVFVYRARAKDLSKGSLCDG